jgi:hypothetical protein
MPVDNGVLAAAANAALAIPTWYQPPKTDFGPDIATQTQEGQFHPRVDVVRTKLSGLNSAQRQSVLQARLNWLTERKAAAESALTALNLSPDLPSTLANSTLGSADWPLSHASVRVTQLSYRLKAGATAHSGEEVFSTDRAFAALTDSTIISSDAADANRACALLLQMRCLADVYARWESCAQVTSAVVGSQLSSPPLSNAEMLARVLTFSRIEGDMSIPPEEDTLEGTDSGDDGNHVPLPPGRSRFFPIVHPSAYMCCVTFLALKHGNNTHHNPFDLSDPQVMLQTADVSFTLALAGLDALWGSQATQNDLERLFPGDPDPFPSPWDALDWPALNRQIPATVTHAEARAAALADLTARRALLKPTPVGPAAGQAVRTTAVAGAGSGARYAQLVLAEGVRYLNRLASGPVRFGPGAPARLPEILVYCLYHMGTMAKALLASAAANSLRSRSYSSYAKALSKAMHDAGLSTDLELKLASVYYATPEASIKAATDNWGQIGPLLGAEHVNKALGDYLRHEKDDVWTAWVRPRPEPGDPPIFHGSSPRGNCIGYAQLYEYLTSQVH